MLLVNYHIFLEVLYQVLLNWETFIVGDVEYQQYHVQSVKTNYVKL
jgi:hypothetical protein